MQRQADGKWSEVYTLPANLRLTEIERDAIGVHVVELKELLAQTPIGDAEVEQSALRSLALLFNTLPAQGQNDEAAAELRGEAYLLALDDLPGWAIRSAVMRWLRGDCAEVAPAETPFSFKWQPAPGELRRVAYHEMFKVKARMMELQRICEAALPAFTDEHCDKMQAKLREINVWGASIAPTDCEAAAG
jgi:hypothetical protein